MDLLSLIASAIAVQGTLTTTLRRVEDSISSVNGAGREFLEILNELQDLKTLLGLIPQHRPLLGSETAITQSLHSLLQTIIRFDKILESMKKKKWKKWNRLSWQKAPVQELLYELRRSRDSLNGLLQAENLHRLETSQLTMETTLRQMNGLSLEKLQETSVHSNYVSESSASARRRSDALERQDHDSAADRLNRNVAEKSAALQAEKTNERTKTSPHSLKNVCGICYCRYRTVQKPGSMIYQQGGSMTSSIRLCYIPPPWLTSQMFELTAGWIQDTARTWLFRLHSYRIIHSDLMSIKSANVEVLRAALAAQELSIHDIDQKGRSLLWHTVSFESLDACAFLLQSGADPFFESLVTGESPVSTAWELVSNHNRQFAAQALRLIDLFSSFIGLDQAMLNSKATEVHAHSMTDETRSDDQQEKDIFLDAPTHQGDGISDDASLYFDENVEDEDLHVIHTPEFAILNALDSQARTLLSNAAAMDDSKAIVALLSYDADANIADVAGWTPLHVAANQGNLKAAISLLDPANFNAPISSADILAKDSVNRVDARDNIGRTPLSIAIRSQKTDVALLFIQQGADIDLRDYYGRSPIFHAIMYNNLSIIDALLQRNCNATFVGKDLGTILHTAAAYATSSTLARLSSYFDLPSLPVHCLPNTMALDEQGRTALKCAHQTIDATDMPLYTSLEFERLIAIIELQPQMQRFEVIPEDNASSVPSTLSVVLFNTVSVIFPIMIMAIVDTRVNSTPTLVKNGSGLVDWLVSLIWLRLNLIPFLKHFVSSFFWKRMVGFARQCITKPTPTNKVFGGFLGPRVGSRSNASSAPATLSDTAKILSVTITVTLPFMTRAIIDTWGNNTTTLLKRWSGFLVWLISLVWLSLFLKCLGSSFFWKRMVGFVKQLITKPTPTKEVRVQWFCHTCGQYLVDHFVELKPGAAANLQRHLRRTAGLAHYAEEGEHRQLQPEQDGDWFTGNSENGSSSAATLSRVNATPQSTGVTASSGHSTLGTSSNLSSNPIQMQANSQVASNRQGLSGQPPVAANRYLQNSSQSLSLQQEPKWLLMCSRPHKLPTSLSHLDIAPVFTDKALFRNIREAYYSLKSPWHLWFSLKGVVTIEFVRFSVHHRKFVDIQSPVPSIPPLIEKDNYDYVPYDPSLLPPIGEERMTHLFHHPEHADDVTEISQQAPKKRKTQIDPNDPPAHRQGWGIHVVEGILLERLLFLWAVFFLGGSLAFGICWSILEKDIGGAWTVSAWISALGALLVAFVQYRVN